MNSFKRFFSSIWPSSQTQANDGSESQIDQGQNLENGNDSSEQISNRRIVKIKKSSKNQGAYFDEYDDREPIEIGRSSEKKKRSGNTEKNFPQSFTAEYSQNPKCAQRNDDNEFTDQELKVLQQQSSGHNKRQKITNEGSKIFGNRQFNYQFGEQRNQPKLKIKSQRKSDGSVKQNQSNKSKKQVSPSRQSLNPVDCPSNDFESFHFQGERSPQENEEISNLSENAIENSEHEPVTNMLRQICNQTQQNSATQIDKNQFGVSNDQFSFGGETVRDDKSLKPSPERTEKGLSEPIQQEQAPIIKQPEISPEELMLQNLKNKINNQKKAANSSMRKVEGLTCPICMDYIISCRIAICGHSFCHNCIAECMVRKKECPQCRKNIRRKVLQPSLLIDNSVKMIAYGKKQEGDISDYLRWNERMQAYNKWVKSHFIESVKPGEKIDACDTEYIWCKATVEMVIKTNNRKDLLYIHYEGWNRKYDEYIYIDSHRVAPLGIYTQRQDIPIYRMLGGGSNQNNNLMMYAVVLQNAAEEARFVDHERRMRNQLNQNENEEEDESMHENENASHIEEVAVEEEQDPAVSNAVLANPNEHQEPSIAPLQRLPANASNNDASADVEPISPIQQVVPVQNEQAIIEAELDRTLEHVNNQLEQHQNNIRPSIIPVSNATGSPVNTSQSQVALGATSEPVVEQQILGSSLAPAAEDISNNDQENAQPQNQPPVAAAVSSEIQPQTAPANMDKPTQKQDEIFKEQKKALEKIMAQKKEKEDQAKKDQDKKDK